MKKLDLKIFLQFLPALVVILVQLLTGFFAPFGDCQLEAGLKHEGLSPFCHLDRAQFLVGPIVEALGVWSVRSHHGVERGAPWTKTLLLCLVFAKDQTHEL